MIGSSDKEYDNQNVQRLFPQSNCYGVGYFDIYKDKTKTRNNIDQ